MFGGCTCVARRRAELGRPTDRGVVRRGRARDARHGHGLRRHQPRRRANADRATARPAYRSSRSMSTVASGDRRRDRRLPSAGIPSRACGTFPRAITGSSRSSTSTREFARADGHTVWLHMDQWEGQNWKRSPGNLYGDPVKITFDPQSYDADQARRRQGDSAGAGAGRHRHGQAHQDPEPDPDQVVGPSDLSRRDRAAAEGLRRASGREYPVVYIRDTSRCRAPGGFGARRRFDKLLARRTRRRESSTSRSSIRRRTTTIPTA